MLVMTKRRERTHTLIRCSNCGRVLGEMVAGCIAIRHHGREIIAIADHVIAIGCECGEVWRQDVDSRQAERVQ